MLPGIRLASFYIAGPISVEEYLHFKLVDIVGFVSPPFNLPVTDCSPIAQGSIRWPRCPVWCSLPHSTNQQSGSNTADCSAVSHSPPFVAGGQVQWEFSTISLRSTQNASTIFVHRHVDWWKIDSRCAELGCPKIYENLRTMSPWSYEFKLLLVWHTLPRYGKRKPYRLYILPDM